LEKYDPHGVFLEKYKQQIKYKEK